jgi:hypothetical protein
MMWHKLLHELLYQPVQAPPAAWVHFVNVVLHLCHRKELLVASLTFVFMSVAWIIQNCSVSCSHRRFNALELSSCLMIVSSGTTQFAPVMWRDAACLVFADWASVLYFQWVTGLTLLMFCSSSKVPDVLLSLGSLLISTYRIGHSNSLSRTTEYKSKFGCK